MLQQLSDWPRLLHDQRLCALDDAPCFRERIVTLADRYTAALRANGTISAQRIAAAAQRLRKHCTLMRLEKGGRVLVDQSWAPPKGRLWYTGRFTDVACLLEYAASRGELGPPSSVTADLLVCGSDGLNAAEARLLDGVPALTITRHPLCPSCIPVPMFARGATSDLSTPPSSFSSTPLGKLLSGGAPPRHASNRTRGDRSRLDGERSRTGGEQSRHERWQEKKPTAFFRGRDWTCFGMRASAYAMRATPLCPNAKSRCARFYERGYYEGRDADAPVALTVSDPCYRARLVNGLRRWPRLFDVASGHGPRFVPVPEAAWEQSTPEPRAVHSSRRIPCTVHH